MIELSGLTKTFSGHLALDNVDLYIQEGEIFGIIGQSGAGKSTLLRCLNLLEKPEQGEVILDGQDITRLNPGKLREARKKTAMIFQHFNLLNNLSVYDNIALPMKIQGFSDETIKPKIDELLELVGLSEKASGWPSQLSGGQKQRVAIARALTCSPKILLCDEATSALDPATTDAILNLLKKINQLYGITIVLITHEMDVIKRICHRLAVMEKGKIIEQCSLAEAFKNPKSQAREQLFAQLSPQLPPCLSSRLVEGATDRCLLRLFFEGEEATVPFISKTSRELHLDINILLANIDRFDTLTCGVLVVEVQAGPMLLAEFKKACDEAQISVETIGYVNEHVL